MLHDQMEGTDMSDCNRSASMAGMQKSDSLMGAHSEGASPSGREYFTRSKMVTEHKAAGVLPLCVQRSGSALVLLGAEATRTGPSGTIIKTMCRVLSNPILGCLLDLYIETSTIWVTQRLTTPFTCCLQGGTLAAGGRQSMRM